MIPSTQPQPALDAGKADAAGRLDSLLQELADDPSDATAIMREHLQAARFYLLGSMPAEFRESLDLAREALPGMTDRAHAARVEEFLQSFGDSRS